jgi:hypothetical protein
VKNVELLKARGETGEAANSDWFIVLLALALFLLALCLPLLVVVFALYALFAAA